MPPYGTPEGVFATAQTLSAQVRAPGHRSHRERQERRVASPPTPDSSP